MGRHCLPIVGEDTFHSAPPPPPACCDSNSRTTEPTADSWPLAALVCRRHS